MADRNQGADNRGKYQPLAYISALTTTLIVLTWTGITLANANQPPLPYHVAAVAGVTDLISGAYIGHAQNDPDNIWAVGELPGGAVGGIGGAVFAGATHMIAYHMTKAYSAIPECVRTQINLAVREGVSRLPSLTDII